MAKILIVEDEKDIVNILKIALEKHGYEVISVQNGEEAIEKINLLIPDLIILDLMLPKVDGNSVNLKLKENPQTQNIPVIVITGKGQLRELFNLKEGVNISGYFEKPFPVKILINKVKELLK